MWPLLFLAQASGEGPVAQIARTFGVDWPHLFAQLISFGLVCALLYRFAYRRVLQVLEQRRKTIAEGLANAEKSKAEFARAQTQRQEILEQAHAQATHLLAQAREAAARVQAQETHKAVAAAEQIITQARDTAMREHDRMLTDLRREVGHLVVQTTRTVTGKVLTPEDQQRLAEAANQALAP